MALGYLSWLINVSLHHHIPLNWPFAMTLSCLDRLRSSTLRAGLNLDDVALFLLHFALEVFDVRFQPRSSGVWVSTLMESGLGVLN